MIFDDETYWLNDYGRVTLQSKNNENIFAHRDYSWVDRVVILDESTGRKIIGQYSIQDIDLCEWIPITKEEDKYVKKTYREIKQIRRKLRIKKLFEC